MTSLGRHLNAKKESDQNFLGSKSSPGKGNSKFLMFTAEEARVLGAKQ